MSDKKLASTSRDARYSFLLMISQADDQGLLLGEPRQLLGSIYPHDADVTFEILEGWVQELIGIGAIRFRHTRDGTRVIEITNWSRHQKVDHPSLPILQALLVPLNGSSPIPPESLARGSRSDLVPSTKDHGPGTVEVEEDRSAAAATESKFSTIREQLPARSRKAFDGLRKATQGATGLFALCAELDMIAKGERNIDPKPTWEGIGMALEDLVLNGARATARNLRTYTADAMRMVTKGTKSRARAEDDGLSNNPMRRSRQKRGEV